MLSGLPLLGNALEFRNDPLKLFRRGYDQYGPVFGIKLAMQSAVVLIGPEKNRLFFESTDDALSMSEIYQFLVPIIGAKVLFTAPLDEYKEQRRIMLPAFQGKKMRSYITEMANESNEWLDTLGESGEFELISTCEHLTMAVAARSIMGPRFRKQLGPELTRLFVDLSGGLEFILPTNLPLPRFIRRDRALHKIQNMLRALVVERRANPDQYDDFLQVVLTTNYIGDRPMSDDMIVAILIGLMFGGRENTAGHLAWGLVQLLQHRDNLTRVEEENRRVMRPGEAVSPEVLKELRWLEWSLKETERVKPMTVNLVRLTAKPYEVDGFTVPKGWLTVAGIALSQRLPNLFRDPERYDPARFSPERAEEVPYSIVGFGGGVHKCWAMAFVYQEMKTILGLLLQRYEVSLVDPNPKSETNDIGVSRPKRPTMIRYRRRH